MVPASGVTGIEISQEALTAICRKYHARELAVFGSAVRGYAATMSTPRQQSGFFFRIWTGGDPDWTRVARARDGLRPHQDEARDGSG